MPYARRTDPLTSHAAAHSAEGLASDHRTIIFAAMAREMRPLASEQCADLTGLSHWQVTRRMSELEEAGQIVRTEEKHKNRSGRWAFKYRIAAAQMEMKL